MKFCFIIIMFSLCFVSLLISAFYFWLYRIFEYKHHKIGKANGILKKTKYKKDVHIYGKNSLNGPWKLITIIKNWSKGLYVYKVNDKQYKIRHIEYVKTREMPLVVQVNYLKIFPRIAYIKTDTNFHNFDIYSFVALIFAVLFALWGLDLLF